MAAAVNLIEDHGANIEQITVVSIRIRHKPSLPFQISAITCPPAIENLRQLFPVPRVRYQYKNTSTTSEHCLLALLPVLPQIKLTLELLFLFSGFACMSLQVDHVLNEKG